MNWLDRLKAKLENLDKDPESLIEVAEVNYANQLINHLEGEIIHWRREAEYYRNIVMNRTGLVTQTEPRPESDLEVKDYQPIHRMTPSNARAEFRRRINEKLKTQPQSEPLPTTGTTKE